MADDFARFDVDNSGFIDADELMEALPVMFPDTTFTKTYVQLLLSKYDSNWDGVLDQAEFGSLVKHVRENPNDDFATFDVDNSGYIDSAELSEALPAMFPNVAFTPTLMKTLLDKFDQNHDGVLDQREFKQLVEHVRQGQSA